MAEMFIKFREFLVSAYGTAKPRVWRIWKAYGYYISLACLLTVFGTAAYFYRTGNTDYSAEIAAIRSDTLPAMAHVAATAEPTHAPTPEPYSPHFSLPVPGGECGEFTADELVWNDTLGHWSVHNGIDIIAPAGSVVIASEDGTVSAVYEDDLYGYVIEITHQEGWVTRYCSLSTLNMVKVGDSVKKGDIISAVGSTAIVENNIGAHLHFEVYMNGIQQQVTFE